MFHHDHIDMPPFAPDYMCGHDCCHHQPEPPHCPSHIPEPPCGAPMPPHRPHHPHRPRPCKPQINDYHFYDFTDDAPLISIREQVRHYLDKHHHCHHEGHCGAPMFGEEPCHPHQIDDIRHDIHKIQHEINDVERAILDEIRNIPIPEIATKSDVAKIAEDVNEHIDYRFDEINFPQQFDDLNQMIRNMLNND